MIWKKFMTGAEPLVREQDPLVASTERDRGWAFEMPTGSTAPTSCNVIACSARYRSFRAEDCTYQPYWGGRRVCDIDQPSGFGSLLAKLLGQDPRTLSQQPVQADDAQQAVTQAAGAIEPPETTASINEAPNWPGSEGMIDETSSPVSGACNVAACSARYRSFNAADCTFQPFGGGPRQLCEIGSLDANVGPSSELLTDDPAGDEEAYGGPPELIDEEGRLVVLEPETDPDAMIYEEMEDVPLCNVAACAAEYSSFRAEDCTYQPIDGGPRQYCEF
jgi:hypothetical protein